MCLSALLCALACAAPAWAGDSPAMRTYLHMKQDGELYLGEGLAEATHLWGIHAAETRMQASADECWSMQRKKMHLGHSIETASLCGHVHVDEGRGSFVSAYIPLVVQDRQFDASGQFVYRKPSARFGAPPPAGMVGDTILVKEKIF